MKKAQKSLLATILASALLLPRLALAAQPVEELTDEDDLFASMQDNMVLCRGFESDLLSLAGSGYSSMLYAQLSPKQEALDSITGDKITSLYVDLVVAYKDGTTVDLQSYFTNFGKLVDDQKAFSDPQIWAIARSHYYLSYMTYASSHDAESYFQFSHLLLRKLLLIEKSEIRDRAILYIISNIAALDYRSEHISIFQSSLVSFLTEMRSYFHYVQGRMNRKITNYRKQFSGIYDSFIEKSEIGISSYKTEIEGDLILLFHMQSSFRYILTGEYSSMNIGLKPVLAAANSLTSLSAICSPGLLRANVKLMHHRFSTYRGGKDAGSVTERFIFDFFDLNEKFSPRFWFEQR